VPKINRSSKSSLMHICTRCGHTHWPDAGHSDPEEQASSSSKAVL
jgi:hypothetical protein